MVKEVVASGGREGETGWGRRGLKVREETLLDRGEDLAQGGIL